MPGDPSSKGSQLMPVFARRFLFAVSILFFIAGSALAWPSPGRIKRKKPAAPSIPIGVRPAEKGPFPTGPYAGPPPVALVHAVRTPPLRKMPVIPPPHRGDVVEKLEPPHPDRPK